MLKGLSPEESEWLARKAARLGGLAGALCFVLRTGRLGWLSIVESEQPAGAPSACADYVRELRAAARRSGGETAAASAGDDSA